jgi:hypothetical protein
MPTFVTVNVRGAYCGPTLVSPISPHYALSLVLSPAVLTLICAITQKSSIRMRYRLLITTRTLEKHLPTQIKHGDGFWSESDELLCK